MTLPISHFTNRIKIGEHLTREDSYHVFSTMLSNENINEQEVANFLIALSDKGETAEEILGAVQILQEMAGFINVPKEFQDKLVDTCGTGGDGLNTYNISTAVAFVVSACGVPVAKHGNKSVSSKSGSSDVLSELGINIMAAKDKVEQCLQEANMCFLLAPLYHQTMKNVAPIRANLKQKTIFNLLGPLLNPAKAKRQLIGVYSKNLIPTYANVLNKLRTTKAWVVHGNDGLDEISISGETFVGEISNGAIDQFEIFPQDFGLTAQELKHIQGGDPKHNALALQELLQGKKSAYMDIVLCNAASMLYIAEKVSNPLDGVELAKEAIKSGKAKLVLDKLIKITN